MILVDKKTRVVVQGITGRQGRFHTKTMLDYGTNVVAGVTPGKGGETVDGIPVYNSIQEVEEDITSSIIFVPAPYTKDAVMEAVNASLNPLVVITEHIPVHDAISFIARAEEKEIKIIGPNTPGVVSVEECKLGIMPNHIFIKGNIAVVSRSGTLTYEIVSQLSAAGMGQSTVVGLGGDPATGMDFLSVLDLLEKDDDTKAVVLIGEIGGSSEEKAAEYIKSEFTKPVIAYVAGRTAPEGKTMGHAGAIISQGKGTHESKKKALEKAGVAVASLPGGVIDALNDVI